MKLEKAGQDECGGESGNEREKILKKTQKHVYLCLYFVVVYAYLSHDSTPSTRSFPVRYQAWVLAVAKTEKLPLSFSPYRSIG